MRLPLLVATLLSTLTAAPVLAETAVPTVTPAAPVERAYKVNGFRSATFGMTKEAVMGAITRDFGIPPAKVTPGQNDVEQTTSLSVAVPTLPPGPGAAKVTYVFGATQRVLMHVAVQWVTSDKLTDAQRHAIVTAGLQLVNYFRSYSWKDGRVAVGVPAGPNSVVLFAATDASDGGVQVSAEGIQFERVQGAAVERSPPPPTGPAALTVAYTANSKSPDVYLIPEGKF
jgi:hypothetical protein